MRTISLIHEDLFDIFAHAIKRIQIGDKEDITRKIALLDILDTGGRRMNG